MYSRKQAVKDAGGNAHVAAVLVCSEQRLSNWVDRGIPVPQCAAFERATGGRWRRWDERPDDWFEIWPELVGTSGAPARRTPEPAETQGAV